MVQNSKTVDRYIMVDAKSPGALQTIVEQHMRKGFQPFGPVLLSGGTYSQPMVVYRPTIGFLAVVDLDTPTEIFDESDGGEGYTPEPYSDPVPFIIRNVVGNWAREILRSESPYTLPDTPVTIEDPDGNVLLVSNVSSIKGETLVISVLKPYTSLTDDSTAPIYYIGWTDDGIIYYISRITVALDGTSVSASATGAWTDRYTLIYN